VRCSQCRTPVLNALSARAKRVVWHGLIKEKVPTAQFVIPDVDGLPHHTQHPSVAAHPAAGIGVPKPKAHQRPSAFRRAVDLTSTEEFRNVQ
jgi:hypothetical protein